MDKEIIRRITLKPIRCIRQSEANPYMRGLVMKRDLTTREACLIYREIFLFNLDLAIRDCDDREARNDYYKEITDEMNAYIKGDVGFHSLQDTTCLWNEDEDDSPSIASHLRLAEYLQKIGVI